MSPDVIFSNTMYSGDCVLSAEPMVYLPLAIKGGGVVTTPIKHLVTNNSMGTLNTLCFLIQV